MSLSQYHWCCQYHESMSIPLVQVYPMIPCLYHESMSWLILSLFQYVTVTKPKITAALPNSFLELWSHFENDQSLPSQLEAFFLLLSDLQQALFFSMPRYWIHKCLSNPYMVHFCMKYKIQSDSLFRESFHMLSKNEWYISRVDILFCPWFLIVNWKLLETMLSFHYVLNFHLAQDHQNVVC